MEETATQQSLSSENTNVSSNSSDQEKLITIEPPSYTATDTLTQEKDIHDSEGKNDFVWLNHKTNYYVILFYVEKRANRWIFTIWTLYDKGS